ncbi:YitT family protein [Desulfocurvibacter africanus]|uniref:YitT family protein n=1 Tax=Desulfocurvibacter africanus TaxID=873 RepID=UPI002FD9468A
MTKRFDYTYSVWWNLLLIIVGSAVQAFGLKAIAVQHGFVASGVFGAGMLINYATGWLTPGIFYFLLNLPLFVVGWLFVSRRFLWYSAFAMAVITGLYEVMPSSSGIQDQLHAAVASGALVGMGAGLVLRSLGSNGGLDVIAVLLFQRYNIGIGKLYFAYNLILFAFALTALPVDLVIASLIMVFITSVGVEYVLSMFSQRKSVFIVSDKNREIARDIMDKLRQGATYIKGYGAYSGREKDILMTVVNNVQLKKLEEIVFTNDDHALFIVENTFNVLGASFSKRKIY